MGELRDDVLDEARSRSETLTLPGLIMILETHGVDGGRGVSRETIESYAAELNYDPDTVIEEVEDRLTDAEQWTEGDVLYRLGDDRVSNYPPNWHERLGDTTDLTEHVELMMEDVTEPEGDRRTAVTEAGVPEQELLRVAGAVSGMDRETARGKLQDMRKKGYLEEGVDQHPTPRVRLPDGTDSAE